MNTPGTVFASPYAVIEEREPSAPASVEELSAKERRVLMAPIYARGDWLAGLFICLHGLIALGLACFYHTWLVTGVITFCAMAMFMLSAKLLPRTFITRCIAGISLQVFVALHIYQMHGLPEMHFFFFTSFTMLIVYQDWKCMWPGALGLVLQHVGFALLGNAGVEEGRIFFGDDYVGATKITIHLGIACSQVVICGYWAHLLQSRTLASAVQNARMAASSRQAKAREERFRALVANAPDAIVVVDAEGEIRYESPAVERGLGYKPEARLGRSVFEMVHPDDEPETRALFGHLQSASATDGPVSRELRCRHQDGSWRTLEVAASPINPASAEIVINFRDVTERRHAEREARRRAHQQNATNEIARQALAGTPLSELLHTTVKLVARTLEVECCYVGEVADDDPEHLLVRAEHGYPPDERGENKIRRGSFSQGGYTLQIGEPVLVDDLWQETRFERSKLARKQKVRSGLSVVIGPPEAAFGVLVSQSIHPGRFSRDDVAFVSGVADVLSSALARRSAEEALREGEERHHALVRISSQMLWTALPSGELIDSADWSDYTGQTPAEIANGGWILVLHPEDQERALQAWNRSLATKGLYAAEYRVRRRDGQYEHFSAQAVPLLDEAGHVRRWIGGNTNITARKEAERAMQVARHEAEEANRAKSEFLSRMSHELRTPLNAVLGFGQLLELGLQAETELESVEHILRAGRHLLALIDEVLDISRIEAGRMRLSLEPVNLGEIMAECLSLVSRQAESHQITCDGQRFQEEAENVHVRADRQRLRQVLLNLLSNAVKYNRTGGQVIMSCRRVSSAGGVSAGMGSGDWLNNMTHPPRLRIEVEDTGFGIIAEEIPRLFTPFERLGAERSATKGTGLGLVLSKKLVEAMGGTIGVDSLLGKGSVFWLELPVASPPVSQGNMSIATTGIDQLETQYQGTVLYIEDNLSNVRLLEMLSASHFGFELLTAMDGASGLAMARSRRPDLILLDLHLPEMPGWEVLEQLQAEADTRQIPVVIISADAIPGQRLRLLRAGAREYLTKPIEVAKLKLVLDDYLPLKCVGV